MFNINQRKTIKVAVLFFVFISSLIIAQQRSFKDENGIYLACEKMPEIKGGLKTIASMIKYPPKARKEKVQGMVYVQFVVDEKGKVSSQKIIRSLGAGCDEEALRVVSKLKIKPGYEKGVPVKVKMTLPFRFKL
tara:strand:+ start:466 stop:867 length:402 start_codon:yes stop_codon:yes gene_type:complete